LASDARWRWCTPFIWVVIARQ